MRISDWSSDVCSSDLRQTEAGLSFSDDDIERHQRFEPAAQRIALGQANVDNVHVVAMPDLVDDFDAEMAILQQLCTFPPLNAFSEHLQIAAQVEHQIGRAHVCTPVTNAHLVCRLLLEKKK